jgi:hypothetical protein
MLIWDGFGTHKTLEILEFCFENNIILCRLPSHTSHKLQPCDVGVFGPLKTAYREQVERMERGGVNTVRKQHFTYLYSPARVSSFTKRNILAAWRGSSLFPLNSERVLANVPKPPTELRISNVDKLRFDSCLGYQALPTPVSGEDLTSLLDRIKSVPDNEASSQHKGRLQQKVANAAQTYLAKIALLNDRNTFLAKINNEGKDRRSADSKILGTAKVMSYEDLEKARAERDVKDAKKAEKQARNAMKEAEGATVGKNARSRKRKSAVLEAVATEPMAKVARIRERQVTEVEQGDAQELRAKVARTSKARAEEDGRTREPWKAPVARMW